MENELQARISQYQDGAITAHEFILTICGLYLKYKEQIDSDPSGFSIEESTFSICELCHQPAIPGTSCLGDLEHDTDD